MTQALYFKPSYERLRDRIAAVAPTLDVCLYDENGRIFHQGEEVAIGDIAPEYFWIHSELFFSPRLKDYFILMLDCPTIKWLHTVNTGLDKLPYLDLVERGVTVTNNHAQAIAIAEFVFGQVLAHFQDIASFRASQQQKIWQHRGFREIQDSHWVIVGFGHIGQAVAKRAKAFGARVTAVRRQHDSAGLADAVVTQAQLSKVLPTADVVVLACAANSETRHLVDAAFLAAMGERAVLVNIARGDLVVEEDLHAALDQGRPGHAVLDVFNREPPPPESWVWTHPRVALTPHTSNAGSGMRRRSESTFLANLDHARQGLPLLNVVTRSDIV
jgi:phosphoglycerate dehydrogenase-like enzyme